MNNDTPNTPTEQLLARVTTANGGRYAPPRQSGLAWSAAEDDVPPEASDKIEAQAAEAFNAACGEPTGSVASLCALLWPGQAVTPEHEAFASRHALALLARAAESPPLMAAIGLVWKADVAQWHDDFGTLKKHLRSKGLTRGGWTVLSHTGGRLWEAALGTPRFADAPLATVISLANGVAAQGRDGLPPDAVVRMLIDADGHMALGEETRLFAPKLLRAVWERWEAGQVGQSYSDLVQEIVDVVDWWHRSERHTVDIPTGARWSWFLTSAEEWWSREEAASRANTERWPASLPVTQVDGYRVVPLSDPMLVWEEARTLRHCLYDDIGMRADLAAGNVAAFSIRRPGAKRPLATFTTRRTYAVIEPALGREHGVLVLKEMKGFANLDVDPSLHVLARRYLAEQQSEVFGRFFGAEDFVEDQDVLLVRPDWPENVGRTGYVCSLEPALEGEAQHRGECRVDWRRGYQQPANFEQMVPMLRVVWSPRGAFDKGQGVGCTECGVVGCQQHLVAHVEDGRIVGGPYQGASQMLAEFIRQDVFEHVVRGKPLSGPFSERVAREFTRLSEPGDALLPSDLARAREAFDLRWSHIDCDDELRDVVWGILAADDAWSLIEAPGAGTASDEPSCIVYSQDPEASIRRVAQRFLGQPTDDWLYEKPLRVVVCAASAQEPYLWLQVQEDGRWTGLGGWDPQQEGARRNPLPLSLVEDLKRWRSEVDPAANTPSSFHGRGLGLAERVRQALPAQVAVLYAQVDSSLATGPVTPWVEVLGEGQVRVVDPRSIKPQPANAGIPASSIALFKREGAPVQALQPDTAVGTAEGAVEDEGDEDDTDEEAYDDGYEDNGDRCPICRHSLQEGQCEHLLLGLDREEGAVSGALHGEWSALTEDAKRIVFDALVEGTSTGVGARMDTLKARIASRFGWRDHVAEPEDVNDEQDPNDAFPQFEDAWQDAQGDAEVTAILQEALESLPGVESTYFEISSAPGLTWWGDNYWAVDPQLAMVAFRTRLQEREA